MFQTKLTKKIKAHTLCSIIFFPENRAVYDMMWTINVERGRLQTTIRRMRTTSWTSKATNAQEEYVILIDFPLKQRLHERASTLRYMRIACLFVYCFHALIIKHKMENHGTVTPKLVAQNKI